MQMFTEVKGYTSAQNARRAAERKGIDLSETRYMIAACGPDSDRYIVVVGTDDMHLVHTGVIAVFR